MTVRLDLYERTRRIEQRLDAIENKLPERTIDPRTGKMREFQSMPYRAVTEVIGICRELLQLLRAVR